MPKQPLQVRLEAADHRPGQFTLTFDSSQYPLILNPEANVTFSDWLRRLRTVLIGQKDPSGELAPQALLRNAGTWLWQALLPDGAPVQERDALAQALRTGCTPLLLELPDTLTGLPWELLCDPKPPAEKGFLARRRPLMRFHPSDTSMSPLPFPLRVLLLISSPPGLGEDSRVDVESERAAVEQATRMAREEGKLHLLVEDIVTLQRVQDALIGFQPHIVHYIGHGGYDAASGGTLLWEDERGNELLVSDVRLAEILCSRNLHAVVLHACQTGRSDARMDVLGVAGTLVNEGIPAVLAQQANFTYESSQRASKAWYTALTARRGLAEALFEVRQALALADRPDWAVPILQGTAASLAPLVDATALPGPPDPLLKSRGAAADLPTPTGVFVGRHRELRELRLMLENAPGSGPVMALITGPGGVGKSTLAAQAVTRSGGKYKAALTLSCEGYQGIELFLQRMGEFVKRLGAPGFLELTLPDPKLSTEAKIEEAIAALNSAGPLLLVVDNLESVQTEDQTLRDASLLHLLQKLLTNLRGGRVLITGRYVVKDLLPHGKFAAHLLRLDLNDLSPYETNQLLTRHPALAHLGETVRETLIREFGGLPYVYDLLSSDAASQSLDLLVHDAQGRITKERKQHSAEQWQAVRRKVVEFAALEATVSRLSEPSRTLLARLGVLQQSFPLVAIEQGLGEVRAAWQPLLDWSLLRYDPLEQTYRLHSVTRHYAEDLLDEQHRTQAQTQLAAWYEHYATRESHDLADYLEAHRLLRAVGNVQQAGELVMRLAEVLRRFGLYPLLRELCTTTLLDIRESDELLASQTLNELGNIAYLQGEYEEARRLYAQSLEIEERLGDQGGRASTLHALGTIAQQQGEYEEARRLYAQSLEIVERLGDQSGRANSFGQMGLLAYEQGDFEHALTYLVQAYILFDSLQSPSREIAQRMIDRIRSHMDEATFTARWRTIAGGRPLPILPDEETNQQLLQQLIQVVIDFIQTPTWGKSKRFLESHLELLQLEVDAVLQALAAQQEHEGARKTIEEHRFLLADCRDNGIESAFAEYQGAKSPEMENTDEDEALTVEELPGVVSSVISQGTIQERQQFAASLIEAQRQLPPEGVALGKFFGCLAAALRNETPEVESLEAPFTDLWQAFQNTLRSTPDE
ncbi:MAG: CHAT domain-containing protein [Ktedonobacteraceae bacterium]